MKKSLMLLICILISSPVFATKPDVLDKSVMNLFEIGVRPDRDNDFADVARQTISASVGHEEGTLAMYALHAATIHVMHSWWSSMKTKALTTNI